MGIPGYFSWLLRQHSTNIDTLLSKVIQQNTDFLCIDANCLFHPQAHEAVQQLIKKHDNKIHEINQEEVYQAIFKKIKDYIDHLIDIVKPSSTFIAVDGLPPIQKMQQQRKRRVLKYLLKEDTHDVFDASTQITPGTEFMKELDSELLKYLEDKQNVTYSGFTENGEGEHKIMQYLKSIDKHSQVTIYGLDSDLIFLAMNDNHKVYLLRESIHLKNNDSNELCMMNIQKMKIFQRNTYGDIFEGTVLMFFMGNDFLPKLSYMKINKEHMKLLTEAYYESHRGTRQSLLSNGINVQFILYMLTYLQQFEYKQWMNVFKKKYYGLDDYVKQHYADNKRLSRMFLSSQDFEKDYYDHFFGINIRTKKGLKQLENICNSYFRCFVWNIKYYQTNNGSIGQDDKYCYQYSSSPLMISLINYLTDGTKDDQYLNLLHSKIPLKDKLRLTCKQQLKLVLQIEHFPKEEHEKIIQCVPQTNEVNTLGCIEQWHCSLVVKNPINFKKASQCL